MPEINSGAEGVRENTKQPTWSYIVHAYTFSESGERWRKQRKNSISPPPHPHPREDESGEHAGKHSLNAGP